MPMKQVNLSMVQMTLLVTAVLIGLLVYKDFGVGWDEAHNYYYGHDVYNQVMRIDGPVGNPEVYQYSPFIHEMFVEAKGYYFSRTHGPLYEFILASMDRIIGIDTPTGIYHFRHAVVFLTFIAALVLFYFYALMITHNPVLATAGSIALFFSPRLFAHAFHNSYDTAFLTFFLAASLCCLKFIRLDTKKWALLAGIACGLAIDIRISSPGLFSRSRSSASR